MPKSAVQGVTAHAELTDPSDVIRSGPVAFVVIAVLTRVASGPAGGVPAVDPPTAVAVGPAGPGAPVDPRLPVDPFGPVGPVWPRGPRGSSPALKSRARSVAFRTFSEVTALVRSCA